MPTRKYVFIVLIIVICLLGSFYSGFFLKSSLTKKDDSYLKPYFSDEIILITKDKPHLTLIAYASRKSQNNKTYTHRQKVFFFDGSIWKAKVENKVSETARIVASQIIPKWEITNDPSLVLKQSVEGEVLIDNQKIQFEVPIIYNEIGIRSLENYTIFRSASIGKLKINNKEYESYVLYTRNYSFLSAINLIEITKPIGIETDWVAFWDKKGNFYNIDKTVTTANYEGQYKSHSIAVFKDKDDKIQKSFDIEINKKKENSYKINILEPINKQLDLNFLNYVDKNINPSPYFWETGQLNGYVVLDNDEKIEGFGIYEQLYQ